MSEKTCFVMQRFDNGPYDKRYIETIAPAIRAGGAEPKRADDILGTKPIYQKIEEAITDAEVAFAEISEENGNVFLELGICLALNLPVVIACNREARSVLPFDVSHRPVLFYDTSSQSSYQKLADQVSASIAAALIEREVSAPTPLSRNTGADDFLSIEEDCLLAILKSDADSIIPTSMWQIQRNIQGNRYSETMITLAITKLINSSMAKRIEATNYNNDDYVGYTVTEKGKAHIISNYGKLMDRLKFHDVGGVGGWGDDSEVPF